jgi:hypothetical protein
VWICTPARTIALGVISVEYASHCFVRCYEDRELQIDHDPHEPSHRSWIVMGVISVALIIGIMLVLKYGLEQVVDSLPMPVLALIGGLMLGFGIGMRVGWWDCERYHSRTDGKDG